MLFAVAATAFVSCSKDDTTDAALTEYTGKTKTITISSAIANTRTMLTEDHKIKWEAGDQYRIVFADANYNILSNTLSPKYDPETTEYELEVPEDTKYLCCCYPDLWPSAWYMPKDLSNVVIDLYRENEFKDANVMLSKAELSENNTATVLFKPVVTILEINVYDTSGKSADDYYYSVEAFASEPFAAEASYDFTSDSAELTDFAEYSYKALSFATSDDNKIADSKETGKKFYIAVGKGVYSKLEFEITTNLKGDWDFQTFNYIYKDADISQYSGYTVNIDLAKESDQPEIPTEPLVTDLEVKVFGPWMLSATFNVSSECAKYVIGGMPTEELNLGDGLFSNDGYDEETFIEDAKDALAAGDGYSKWLAFDVTDSSQPQTVTELYMRGGTKDEPNGLRLNDSRGEYMIAVYAVNDFGVGEIYTTTITAPAFSMGNGSVTPTVEATKNQKDSATATISADGAEYIFYGYSNTLTAVPTAAQIKAMFANNEMDTFFEKYESPVTLDFDKYGKNSYLVWAVAIDDKGAISAVASQKFEYKEDVIDFSGSAAVVEIVDQHLWQIGEDSNPFYELETKLTLSDNAAKVAIFYLPRSVTNNADTKIETPITITVDMIKSSLISEMTSPNGTSYTKAQAEKGIRLPLTTYYENAQAQTGLKLDTDYYMYAVAIDEDGVYGKIENLAWIGQFTIDQPAFLQVFKTIELSAEKEEQGGGDNPDLWTGYNVPFFNYDKYNSTIIAYDNGNSAKKMWLIELAQNIPVEDHTYPFPAEAKTKYRTMLGKLFENYATTKEPSADAKILVSFSGNVPHNATTGSFPIADTPWAQDWATDSVYALVAEFEENVLGAVMYSFDDYGDWESMGSVNANNKPQL